MTIDTRGPTASTNAIFDAMRLALLGFENESNVSLRDIIGENLWRNRAPDNQTFPYGTMKLTTRRTSGYSGRRLDGRLEVMLYGRPSSELEVISDAADLCEQAMLDYVNASPGQGLIFTANVQRDELPQGSGDVDSETCTTRIIFTLAIWPAYLTSLTA
jgi:hypothetical protein